MYQRQPGLTDNSEKAVEVRTKLGEALVRATKELADLTPKYKNLLLNAFFGTASDPEPLVRASSLSNLGEVCRNLRLVFNFLKPFIHLKSFFLTLHINIFIT